MRYGEMTAFEERPHSPYYGCADATPLYVVLLDEYERWTGDTKLVRELEHEARAALNWIDEYADLQGNGYVCVPAPQREDRPREPVLEGLLGLDLLPRRPAARASRGRPASCRATPTTPRCAAPGWRAHVWKDPALADRLEKEAADLKRRFNRDFWVEDGEYFALALDADGSQVDALASNNGHLLWSGIVDKSKAKAVAAHLHRRRGSSPAGACARWPRARARYNPIGYHVGTVWPFDNSFIAWGLRRYGFKEEAARIAAGILDAAEFFDGRLPEAFGGYAARADEVPGAVPDRVQPAGLVDRRAAAAAAHDARPRADRRPPRRRPGAAATASATSSCSTSPAAGAASTPSAAAASTSRRRQRARTQPTGPPTPQRAAAPRPDDEGERHDDQHSDRHPRRDPAVQAEPRTVPRQLLTPDRPDPAPWKG